MEKWTVKDYFDIECETDTNALYHYTVTCKICGYTFTHTEDLNYQPSNYRDNVEDVCVEHIMKYHIKHK